MQPGAWVACGVVLALVGCGTPSGSGPGPLAPGGAGGHEVTPSPFALTGVADGFPFLTDIQPVPGQPSILAVSTNGGVLSWVSLADGSRADVLQIPEIDDPREGILGFAFHPKFPADRRVFVHYMVGSPNGDVSRISSFDVSAGTPLGTAADEKILVELEWPLPDHDGGALAFGPDGMLYAAFGDGGHGLTPTSKSQDPLDLWGKMVRLDVDRTSGALPYAIPSDNPFAGRAGIRHEIFALGFRNPWRFSFTPDGTLVVADVGADAWEELNLARGGENFGWNVMEGDACYPPGSTCPTAGMTKPHFKYAHGKGACIVGGHVYQGARLPALRGLYVFADYERGTVWALDLAGAGPPRVVGESGRHLVAIARDSAGELYFGDIISGEILRLDGVDPAP